ncbi:OmpA family protein [Parasalinivibrio latis]|uniref:OmpA family protein n=1 Tax=Parasalinivibrio latis TaxID=2952610 RepID=UPI0030DDF03E
MNMLKVIVIMTSVFSSYAFAAPVCIQLADDVLYTVEIGESRSVKLLRNNVAMEVSPSGVSEGIDVTRFAEKGQVVPCPSYITGQNIVFLDDENILARINFEFDEFTLQEDDQAAMTMIVERLNREDRVWTIEGHTDSKGTDLYNHSLGERRAESVILYLIESGVDESKLQAVSFGEKQPISTNKTKLGRSENRRVDIL